MARIRGLFKRGNIYWYSFYAGKKHLQGSLETNDLNEAIVRLNELRALPILKENKDFKAEVRRFIDYKRDRNVYSVSMAYKARIMLDAFADFYDNPKPSAVTRSMVQNFYEKKRKFVTESTAHSYIMAVRSFFRWCQEIDKSVRYNPVIGVQLSKLDRVARTQFCKPELRDQLIANAPTDSMLFILFCGFHAGLRKNEIIEARPDWFEGNILHVRKTETFRPKDRDERAIPLSEPFRKFLKTYPMRGEFCLMPDVPHGINLYRYDFRKPFVDYMRAQGCPWVTPHVMRHTFASILASRGVSIFKISEWLGDDVRVTQRHYAKLLPDDGDIEKLHVG